MKNNNDMGEAKKSLNDVENESKFIDDKLEGGAVGDERDLHDKLSEGRKYDRLNSNKVQELVAYVSFQSFKKPSEEVANEKEVVGGQLEKWPKRLHTIPPRISRGTVDGVTEKVFQKVSKLWKRRVSYYKSVNN
ncbi:hypothetical protein H5410_031912 [Solanum commersonii]|uniref:Uncharacterized protein n=1 Tax=Solanum commersonii TaxID=4109 RepID=A0A9J5YNT8_SOLCO|nr:hypothetical protein H5410_031912 [Solanum commersonii]